MEHDYTHLVLRLCHMISTGVLTWFDLDLKFSDVEKKTGNKHAEYSGAARPLFTF